MRFGLFRGSRPERPPAPTVERIKSWVLAAPDLAPGTTVTVNEIVCLDPSCPGVETVMLIMAPGKKTRACKIAKAIDEVTEPEVRQALLS